MVAAGILRLSLLGKETGAKKLPQFPVRFRAVPRFRLCAVLPLVACTRGVQLGGGSSGGVVFLLQLPGCVRTTLAGGFSLVSRAVPVNGFSLVSRAVPVNGVSLVSRAVPVNGFSLVSRAVPVNGFWESVPVPSCCVRNKIPPTHPKVRRPVLVERQGFIGFVAKP
jgi:hypothetical protein